MRSFFKLLVMTTMLASCTSAPTNARKTADPVAADPIEFDSAFPPELQPVRFEIAGSRVNGVVYMAAGRGPHPIVIMLQGFPGNEKNADLSQAMRRAGTTVVNFNYRGTWGSQGIFTLENALEDVSYVLAKVSDPQWASRYRADPTKVALVGHSFGGFLGASTTGKNQGVSCYAHLAGADLGVFGMAAETNAEAKDGLTAALKGSMISDGGPVNGNASTFVDLLVEQAGSYSLTSGAAALATRPLLLVAATRDAEVPKSAHHDPLVSALRDAGAKRLTEVIYDDDHAFSAHRIVLARKLVSWQREQCWH